MVKFTSLRADVSQATEPWVFVKALVPKVKPPRSDIKVQQRVTVLLSHLGVRFGDLSKLFVLRELNIFKTYPRCTILVVLPNCSNSVTNSNPEFFYLKEETQSLPVPRI